LVVKKAHIPYHCAVYWKATRSGSCPEIIAYGLAGLVRLNRTASFVWLLSDGHHSERQIFQALKEHFTEVPFARLQEEVDRFLSQAESQGILVRCWDPLQPYRVIGERLIE
jgi:hypothetical protein